MNLGDLNARFDWTGDGKIDSWRVLNAATGPLRGDCDDYALTVLWIVEGNSLAGAIKAMISGQAEFWVVKGRRWASHVVLHHKQLGWIDNQNPTWGECRDVLRYRMPWPIIVLKILIGKLKGN